MSTDVVRAVVVFFGGFTVGMGCVVLSERASYYRRRSLPDGRAAMLALMAVNCMVLAYIAIGILQRWGMPPTWRLPLAALIFGVKAFFFIRLRRLGVEQEYRLALEGGDSWLRRRSDPS